MKRITLFSTLFMVLAFTVAKAQHTYRPTFYSGSVEGIIVDQTGRVISDTIVFTRRIFYPEDSLGAEYRVVSENDTISAGYFRLEYNSAQKACWGVNGPRIVSTAGCFPNRNLDTTGYVIQVQTTRFVPMKIGEGSVNNLQLRYAYDGKNQCYLRGWGTGLPFLRQMGAISPAGDRKSKLASTSETYLAPATHNPTPENLRTTLALFPSSNKPCLYYPLPLDSVKSEHELDEAPDYEDDGWVDTLYLYDESGNHSVDAFYIYLKWCRKYGKAYIVQPPQVNPEEMKAEMVIDITINAQRNDRRLVTYEK